MVFRYLLKGFIFLLLIVNFNCLLIGQVNDQLSSDELEIIKKKATKALNKDLYDDLIQRSGLANSIDCLEESFCHNAPRIELLPNSEWSNYDYIIWQAFDKANNEITSSVIEVEGSTSYFNPSGVEDSELGEWTIIKASLYKTGFPVPVTYPDYTIILFSPTEFDFGSSQEICSNETASLILVGSESLVSYYLWRTGDASPTEIKAGNGSQLVFDVNLAGEYYVTARSNITTCEQSMNGTATVIVHPLPVAAVSSNSPVCEGQTIELYGDPDGMITYAWTGPVSFVSGLQDPTRINSTTGMSGDYILTVTDVNTCQNSATTTVTVNSRPTAVVSGSTTICDGQFTPVSVALTGTQPWSLTYSDGATSTVVPVINASPYIFNVNPSSSTTYTVTALTDNNSCGAVLGDITGSAVISVNERPTSVLSGGGVNTCNGTPVDLTVVLTGAAPWDIIYSDGTGSFPATANSTPFTLTVNPTLTSTYTITGLSDANGCNAQVGEMTGSAAITVLERPTSTISIDGSSVLCNGGSTNVQFDLTGIAPWSLTYEANGVTNTVTANSTPYIVTVTPGITTIYRVTALSDATSCSAIASDIAGDVTVTVNERPTADMSGTTTICNSETAQISVDLTGASPWTIGYSINGVGTSVPGVTDNPYIINATPSPGVETYLLTSLTDGNGCSALATELTGNAVITVNPRPTAIISGGAIICNGGNTPLNIVLSGTGPWSIYIEANGIPLPVINTSTNPYSLSVSPTVTTTYTVAGLTDSKCTAQPVDLTGTALVTVNPRPTVVFSSDANICEGGNVNLTMNLTGTPNWSVDYTYNGSPSNTVIIGPSPGILNVSPTVTTEYVITKITDGNGCVSIPTDISGKPMITVDKRPTSIISGSTTICDGTAANLSVAFTGIAPWSFTYSNGLSSFDLVANVSPYIIPVTPSTLTTYTITALSDGTGCTVWPVDMTGSAVIDVDARPTGSVSIVGLDEFCDGGSTTVQFNLTGDGPWDMIYTINGVPITVSNIISTPYDLPQTPSETSVYQITALNDNNCSANSTDITGTATITVHPRPTSVISGSTIICNGDLTPIRIDLTGTAPWNVEYEANGATVVANNILNSPYIFDVNPSVSTTYVVTKISDANVCDAIVGDMPGSATVTVNARPTGTLSGSTTICQGSSTDLVFTLSGVAPFTVNYTANGTPQSVSGIMVSPYLLPVSPNVFTSYVFTGLSDANCSADAIDISGSADVDVNLRPTGDISGSTSICNGESATLSVALTGLSPWSITYSDGVNPDVTVPNILSSPYTFPVNPIISTTYTLVSVADGNLCSSQPGDLSGLAEITVHPLPIANISGGGTICNGSSIGLTVAFTGTAPWNFSYFDGVSTITETATASPFTLNVNPSLTSTYTITAVEDGNGCDAILSGLSGSALVNVNARPTAVLSGDQDICLGETADLSVILTGLGPWDITYSDGTTTSTITAGSSPFTLPVTPLITSTYTITGLSDASTCTSVPADISGSAVVTVNQVDVVMAALPPASTINTQICYGSTITYEATPSLGSGDYSYQYELRLLPAGLWTNVGTGISTYTTSPTLLVGNYELRVTVTDNFTTCSVLSSVASFEVLLIPPVSLTISDNDVCLNDMVTITALPAGYVSYVFNIDGADFDNGANNVLDINTLTEGTHNIYVTVNNGSCSNTSTPTEQVVVRELPTTSLSLDVPTRTTVCINEPVAFTASGADEYEFFVNGLSQGAKSATNTFSHFSSDNFSVYVIGYNAYGCELQSNTIDIVISKPVAGLTVNPNNAEHCANETLIFTGSGGDSYEFYYNNLSQGIGAVDNFTLFPPLNGDEIYVVVTDGFGCQAKSATRTLIVNPTPIVTLSSDPVDATICEGESVLFTATQDADYYYRFFILRGGIDIQVQEGSLNTFTSSELQNGDQIYVVVRDENSCNSISPSILFTVNPNPVVTLTVLPSSHIGAGDAVQVVAGGADEYQFLLNGIPEGVWSTNDTWNFATPADGDVVSVIGMNNYGLYGCEVEHPGITIEVDALPAIFELRAISTEYCANEPGVQLYLTGYEPDVNYLLINNFGGTEVPFGLGTLVGGVMTWNDVTEGTYFVRATRTTGVGTSIDYTDIVTVVSNPVPDVFNQLPNGTVSDCTGGIVITLDGSTLGIEYRLLLNGSMIVESIVGDGSALTFAPVNFSGTYTIVGENPVTGCQSVMTGSTIVDVLASSTIYNLYSDPASGHFCPGSTGVELWLDGSDVSVTYLLYKDNVEIGSIVGTGNPLMVDNVTDEGVYMVMVAAQNGCIAPMNGSVTVVADPLPTGFNVTAENNGHFCNDGSTVKISLSGQQLGVIYSLWLNGTLLETVTGLVDDASMVLEFAGDYNTEDDYSVTGMLPGGCEGPMNNIVTLVADALPTAFEVNGDAGFCTGGSSNIYLNGSESGVDYELFLDGVTTGDIIPGNGGVLHFIVNQEGEYTIVGTNKTTVTGCSNLMTGSLVVAEILYPDINVVVSTVEVGTVCDKGMSFTIVGSEIDVVYELFKVEGVTQIFTGNIVTGDGNDVVFPSIVKDKDATYYIQARRGACPVTLATSVYVNMPDAVKLFSITGSGDVCIGDAGGTLGLSGSEINVNYQLYSNATAVGAPVPGDGFPLNFGVISSEGDYSIIGTSTVSGCSNTMLGTFNLRFNPLPIAFQLTGSGIYCGEVVGASIGLDGSEVDVNYKLLWFNGSYNELKDDIDGIGLPLFFDGQFSEGNYTVYARNTVTGCTSSMNGDITVVKLPAPDITGITVVMDDNSYCAFDGGVELGLSNGEVGVTYSVIDEISSTEVTSVTPIATGSLILGTIPEGTYRVVASRSGECEVEIESGIIITEKPSPVVYELSGPASGCASSIILNLSGSETGVVYQLFSDAYMLPGNEEGYVAGYDKVGDGNALTFNLTGFESGVSFFWIKASYYDGTNYGCSSTTVWTMIDVRLAATAFSVLLPADYYCAVDPGVLIGVSTTDIGVGYQLIKDGNTVDFMEGNGTERWFNLYHTVGTYFIRARHYESGCFFDSESFNIVMHNNPMSYNLSSGGSINDHEITLDGSEGGVKYYLYLDDIEVVQTPLDGNADGSPLSFGTVSLSGIYTVKGIGQEGCSTWMNGTSTIFETPLVAVADTIYLRKGELVGEINVGDNDFFLSGIDILGVNLEFTVTGLPPIGNVTLDPETGLMVYQKLPSFYGKDSVTYIVTNKDIITRASAAKVYIMVGNKDLGDELSFLLPNAFSPNDDGLNDYFVISGLGSTEESSLEVFNRWGTIVYRSQGNSYENDWDGRSNTGAMVSIGKELPNGTYFYIYKVKKNLEGTVVSKNYNGYIELRR